MDDTKPDFTKPKVELEPWQELSILEDIEKTNRPLSEFDFIKLANSVPRLYGLKGTQLRELFRQNSIKGLDFFLIAHSWIWSYQRNAKQLADKIGICKDYAKGKKLWGWIKKLAALKAKKIVWDPAKMDDDPNGPTFICSLDGTDFKVWEPKHPTLPQDRRQMSFKMKHAALKYEIAVCNFESQICWVSGPYRGAKHDLSVFRDGGLKGKNQNGKLLNVDRGYQSSRLDERCLSSRIRSIAKYRTTSCLDRVFVAKYKILENTFRHGREKHELAFLVVVVT
jgi:hypothetical protein